MRKLNIIKTKIATNAQLNTCNTMNPNNRKYYNLLPLTTLGQETRWAYSAATRETTRGLCFCVRVIFLNAHNAPVILSEQRNETETASKQFQNSLETMSKLFCFSQNKTPRGCHGFDFVALTV